MDQSKLDLKEIDSQKYWVCRDCSHMQLRWKPRDPLRLLENSLLFDKYTAAQEEYFLIRNSEFLQEEYWTQ